jgi:hypothetical protein
MKFFNLFSIAIFILSFSSCTKPGKNPELSYTSVREQNVVPDSMNLLFPIRNFIAEKTDSLKMTVYFEVYPSKQLLKCELSEDSIATSIIPSLDSTIWFVNMIYKSNDSMFTFDTESHRLNLQNDSGTTLQMYQVDSKYATLNLLSGYTHRKESFLLMNNSSKTIGFGSTEDRLKYYNKVKPLIILGASNNGLTYKELGFWPQIYRNTGNSYDDAYASGCFGENNNVCISFGADHNIYMFCDTTLQFSKQVKSIYIDTFNPYPDSKIFDMMYLREYSQNEPKYLEVIYDAWENRYYRLAKHRYIKSSSAEKIKRFWSVIVTDDELNVVGELKFSYHYDSRVFIPTPYGILLLKGNTPGSKAKIFSLIKISAHE